MSASKKTSFLFLIFIFLGAACGTASKNSSEEAIQIYRKGESEPLFFLRDHHEGDVVELEAKGEAVRGPVTWWSEIPRSGAFENEGELHLKAPGVFFIGAITGEGKAAYIRVEVERAFSTAPAGGSSVPERPAPSVSDPYIDQMISFQPGVSGGNGSASLPRIVLGPPKGAGRRLGSLDTLSLGLGGEIILKSDTPILNGNGPDFIVFENAFYPFGATISYMEPAEVAVSQDGVHFVAFPCDSNNRLGLYPGCAGVQPVFANADLNPIDATNPAQAGGDAFDLTQVNLEWVLYIRLRDKSDPARSTDGFDLDAISIVHQ